MDEIAQIKEKINLVDLVSETVPLKKAGRNFKGLCPFHTEKSPSFMVSSERQIWHCFGCGKGGDHFAFLMELDKLEFFESLKILAERAGIKLVSRTQSNEKSELKDRLLSLHHLANEYYHFLLTKHTVGERARLYLKERGISDALMKTFELGFAPQSWDNLVKFLHKKGYTDFEIEKSGVAIRGNRGLYDRFRSRIMFPLKDYRGQTIAFAGRVLIPNEKDAKYVNSPETPIYTKGQTLFGLHLTKEAIRKAGSAIIVEGEFDMISSFAAGVPHVVAIKGTALTEAQIHLLKRFTEKLVLALDADVAGDAAARRGIEMADRAGLEVRVIEALIGKDPDETARSKPEVWKDMVTKAVPFYDFLLSSALSRHGTHEAFAKKKIGEELLPQFARIENAIVQGHYLKKLATAIDVSEETLYEQLRKINRPRIPALAPAPEQATLPHAEKAEVYLLALIVQSKEWRDSLTQVLEVLDPSDFIHGSVKKILMHLVELPHEITDLSQIARELPGELKPVFDQACVMDVSQLSVEVWPQELTQTALLIKKEIVRRKIRDITTKIAQETSDGEELTHMQQELVELTTTLKQLS